MFDQYNFSGFELYQPFPDIDQWVFDTKYNRAYHGNLKEICQLMIQKLDFRMDDIEVALNLLADNLHQSHNCVHFGVLKSPIFTCKKDVLNEEKVS